MNNIYLNWNEYNEWLATALESGLTELPVKLNGFVKAFEYVSKKADAGSLNSNAVVHCIIQHTLFQQELTAYITTLKSLLILTEPETPNE